jgi:hypothetical protein
MAWLTKCQEPRAVGGPLGPLASELKTLKVYIFEKRNYVIHIYILWFLFNGKC